MLKVLGCQFVQWCYHKGRSLLFGCCWWRWLRSYGANLWARVHRNNQEFWAEMVEFWIKSKKYVLPECLQTLQRTREFRIFICIQVSVDIGNFSSFWIMSFGNEAISRTIVIPNHDLVYEITFQNLSELSRIVWELGLAIRVLTSWPYVWLSLFLTICPLPRIPSPASLFSP